MQQFFMFFIFNVVLVTSDIVTDFITAVNFFNDGHFYWGICTIVPMFAPFAVRFSVALVEIAKVSLRKVFLFHYAFIVEHLKVCSHVEFSLNLNYVPQR
jgi:hypothetical protein